MHEKYYQPIFFTDEKTEAQKSDVKKKEKKRKVMLLAQGHTTTNQKR